MNILRRLPLSRLLLLCATVVAVGISATALAFALDAGPVPPPAGLADAVHAALAAPQVQGVSARIKLTDRLLEGANLASEGGQSGQLTSNPLISGASGRLWIAKDGRVRLELQAEKGDTQVMYDGHTLSMYDASTNTLYRYTPPAHAEGSGSASGSGANESGDHHEPPTVAKIEEALSHLREHADVSGPTTTDIAGQAAYTVRVSPKEGGSLIGGAELSWDAVHGVPLRAAVYSSTDSAPVIELAATEISYGPVSESVFEFQSPAGAKVEQLGQGGSAQTAARIHPSAASRRAQAVAAARGAGSRKHHARRHKALLAAAGTHPTGHTVGHGLSQITVIESKASSGAAKSVLPEGLPKVKVNSATATQLSTALGTLLTFERSGVRYVLVGAVSPTALQAVARGL